jgi:hypothetical protein
MRSVRYPGVSVRLADADEEGGNAFAILGRAQQALRAAGVGEREIQAFVAEATSGDYYHLRRTVMRWVETDVVDVDSGSPDALED